MTGSAALSLPLFAGRAAAADVDVVVIGAGASGIAAARELRGRGLTVTVVEASSRIGGRVHTDTSVFGVPYDVGAHWLHYREENPFADYAEENGFDLYESPSEEIFYVGGREATDEEYAGFEGAMEDAARAMTRAAVRGKDVSPASVMPDLGEWALSANLYSGAYEMAKDFDHLSCKDWYTAEDGTDYYVREGFGTLFAHSARDVEVALNTPVKEIRWGGSGVEVVTPGGTIQARAAVVTVSMGVLAGGGIKFDPPLPAKKQEAIGGLTMGHYLHVALQLDENFFGVGEGGYFGYKVTKELNGAPMGFGALVDAAGTGITYCDLGGEFAREMSRQGSAATTDFVISELTKIFGSKARAAVRKTHTFDWTSDPLTLGAYASAEPGFAWTRRELRKPEGDRLWFAGEATSKDDWATVAGAHKAGIAAARKVAKKLKT